MSTSPSRRDLFASLAACLAWLGFRAAGAPAAPAHIDTSGHSRLKPSGSSPMSYSTYLGGRTTLTYDASGGRLWLPSGYTCTTITYDAPLPSKNAAEKAPPTPSTSVEECRGQDTPAIPLSGLPGTDGPVSGYGSNENIDRPPHSL